MLSAIIQFSIHNRRLVALVTLAVAIAGIVSLKRLPIDAVPDITNVQVQINALAPALGPIEIEKQVTFVIENALAGIPGLESTRSLSRSGFSQVTAVFKDGTDIYFARQLVGEQLRESDRSLPAGVEITLGPIATGLGEIFMYTVEFAHPRGAGAEQPPTHAGWQSDGTYRTPEGRTLSSDLEFAAYLREVQDWIIRPQLRAVKDVAGVDSIGGFVKQYHVRPDPMRLLAFGLTFSDVIDALERNNVSTGAGFVERNGESYLVRAAGRISDAAELQLIPIATRESVPILMRDIASTAIGIGPELRTGAASMNGEDVVVGTAIMLQGANSRTVAAAVDAKLSEIQRSLPPDVRARPVLNRTKLVDATIATVRKNLVEGAILVVAVLLVLLGNWRGALICAAAIPLAMLITASGMVKAGISGNLMSLGAIDFGLIVDGAVIIVENCVRRLAEKQHAAGRLLTPLERLQETFAATSEVAKPSAFGQAIIITVYFPILALSGVEGKMFHPMAFTVIFALIAAFVLSLTFIPAVVALCISGHIREKEVFIVRWIKGLYEPLIRAALRARFIVAGLALGAFIGSLALFSRLGQEFVPTLDEKDLALHAIRIPGTSLTQSHEMQRGLERAIAEIPEVSLVFSKTGTAELASDPMPPNVSDTFVIFKPRESWRSERELRAEASKLRNANEKNGIHSDASESGNSTGYKVALLELIRARIASLPGQAYEFTQPIQMRFNELISGVRGDVAIKVHGDDFEAMQRAADRVLAVLRDVPGAADARIEQTEGLPVLLIEPDRPALARYGLSVAAINDVIAAAIGGREAGQIFEGDRRFDVLVRLDDSVRENIEQIQRLPILLPPDLLAGSARHHSVGIDLISDQPTSAFVPLGAVARVEVSDGLNQISRENGKRRIVVQCNVMNRDLGSFVAEARSRIDALNIPSGLWLSWGGQYESLAEARSRLALVVPACFALIFILLLATLKNLKDSLLVFAAVPFALAGGILSLWLRGMPFSISAAVGFIALSGIAVLNGLVMITLINQLLSGGTSRDEAIVQGSITRLRPVLMTALVASLGFLPMALATGTGAEVQRPLATVVCGGLITSTLLTLFVLPALYRIFTPNAPT